MGDLVELPTDEGELIDQGALGGGLGVEFFDVFFSGDLVGEVGEEAWRAGWWRRGCVFWRFGRRLFCRRGCGGRWIWGIGGRGKGSLRLMGGRESWWFLRMVGRWRTFVPLVKD